jgi:tetratricopeptide (TPR) repeat protein
MYEYIFSLYKTNYNILKVIWNTYLSIWNTEKAEIYFLKFLEKEKKDIDVLFNLVDIYKKNNKEKSIEFLKKIHKIKPYEKKLKNYL